MNTQLNVKFWLMGRNLREFIYPWRGERSSSTKQQWYCLHRELSCCYFATLIYTHILKGVCFWKKISMLQISFKRNMLCRWNAFIPVSFPGNQLLNTDYMFKLMFIFFFTWLLRCCLCLLPPLHLSQPPSLASPPAPWSPGICLLFLPVVLDSGQSYGSPRLQLLLIHQHFQIFI